MSGNIFRPQAILPRQLEEMRKLFDLIFDTWNRNIDE